MPLKRPSSGFFSPFGARSAAATSLSFGGWSRQTDLSEGTKDRPPRCGRCTGKPARAQQASAFGRMTIVSARGEDDVAVEGRGALGTWFRRLAGARKPSDSAMAPEIEGRPRGSGAGHRFGFCRVRHNGGRVATCEAWAVVSTPPEGEPNASLVVNFPGAGDHRRYFRIRRDRGHRNRHRENPVLRVPGALDHRADLRSPRGLGANRKSRGAGAPSRTLPLPCGWPKTSG